MAQQRRRTLREVLAPESAGGGDADGGDHGCAVPRRRLAGAGAARCEAPPDAPPSPSESEASSSSSSSSSSGSASSAMLESLHDETSSASASEMSLPTPLNRSSSLEGQVGGSGGPSPGGGGWTLKKDGDSWRLESAAAGSSSKSGSDGRGAISVGEKAEARGSGESDDGSSGGSDRKQEREEDEEDDDDEWRLVVPRSAPSAPKRDNDNVQDDGGGVVVGGHESDGEWTSCSEPRPAHDNNGEQAPTEGGAGGGTNNDNLLAVARKAGVAVSGGALVGLGLVMIPLPTPFGCAVAASGMAVLGTEFPAAQRALDDARDNLAAGLERMASLDEGDDQNGRGGEGGEDRVVMNGDAVLVRRPTSMDGEGDGGTVKATDKKGGGSDLDDLAEEAGRALRRKASEFGRRVLPLVVRPTENSEGGKNDTEKSGKDGEGDASADATRGRLIKPSSPRSTARPSSQSRTYLDYIDSVRNLREMDD